MLDAILRLRAYETRERERKPEERQKSRRLVGIAAAPGFGTGRAHILRPLVDFDALDELRAEDPAARVAPLRDARSGARSKTSSV